MDAEEFLNDPCPRSARPSIFELHDPICTDARRCPRWPRLIFVAFATPRPVNRRLEHWCILHSQRGTGGHAHNMCLPCCSCRFRAGGRRSADETDYSLLSAQVESQIHTSSITQLYETLLRLQKVEALASPSQLGHS
jgi:hypothetical protein